MPGFDRRIEREVTMMCPVGTQIQVHNSKDALLGAWRGGAKLCNFIAVNNLLQDFSISKAAYEECGHHYLQENFCANYLYGQQRKPVVEFWCHNKRQRV